MIGMQTCAYPQPKHTWPHEAYHGSRDVSERHPRELAVPEDHKLVREPVSKRASQSRSHVAFTVHDASPEGDYNAMHDSLQFWKACLFLGMV
jgi:hypothetical protein